MNHAGATLPIQSIKTCLVYDRQSGRILHHRRVLTLTGGREPSESEIAADAIRAVAGRRETTVTGVDVLHIHHDTMESGKHYRVDPQQKKLMVD